MSKSKKEASKKEELPIIVSFSLTQVADGWICLKITTQGAEVISIEKLNEPDMKAIAQEKFKISVARELF
jgi:hypothetical protein